MTEDPGAVILPSVPANSGRGGAMIGRSWVVVMDQVGVMMVDRVGVVIMDGLGVMMITGLGG